MILSRRLWFLFTLLAVLTFCQSAEAQPIPTWKNDAQGRPAPPCMILDAATGLSAPCSSANPIPISGGSGTGTTSGTSLTGFGKAWFPSTITGAVAGGQQMIGMFISDTDVALFRRNTGCGSCLQTAVSTDGGVTATFISTAAVLGNSISAAHRVPSSTVRYLVSSIGGPLNIFQSASLTAGWTAVTGIASPVSSWASNTDGSVVLSSDSGNNVCRSTNNGISFGSCVSVPAGQLTYAGGTTWILASTTNVRRSINDGATWGVVAISGANFQRPVCFTPSFGTCIVPDDGGSVTRSTDNGVTWPTIVDTGFGAPSQPAACDYGGGTAAVINLRSAPIGFGAITTDTHSSFNSGLNWFAGQRFGSHWNGAGVVSGTITCRAGRGFVTQTSSGGGTDVWASYNPLTSPGGTLQSSAGGYNVSAPIQAGIVLNTTPVTSAAATPAVVTLTNTAGSRVCIREIVLLSSAASAVVTLTVSDGATVVLNYGIVPTATLGVRFAGGGPIVCSQTSNNLVVNIGSAGGAITTTTSVIADRYPN